MNDLEPTWRSAARRAAARSAHARLVRCNGKFSGTGGSRYLTAIYPDRAVSETCAACHNAHKDSPRHDFKAGDVIGGLVIRIPVE